MIPRIDNTPEELRNLKDEVYAAVETGNHEHARSVGKLIREKYPEAYLALRNEVLRDNSFNI